MSVTEIKRLAKYLGQAWFITFIWSDLVVIRSELSCVSLRLEWHGVVRKFVFRVARLKAAIQRNEHQQSSALSNWNAIKIMDCHHSFFCIRAAAAISTCRDRCNVTPTCLSMVLYGVSAANLRWFEMWDAQFESSKSVQLAFCLASKLNEKKNNLGSCVLLF